MGRRGRGPGAPPQLQAPREIPLSETFGKFLGQEAQLPALQAFADRLNREFRTTLETGLPGTIGATRQISSLVGQLLGGDVPADVQAATQRNAAEQAMAVGLPGTSEMARNIQARDFGLTTMDLMQQGAAYTPGLVDLANFLSPQQAQNYLFSTGQLRGEDLKKAQDDANVANQNAINKYNYDVAKSRSSGGLFGSIGGILGGVAGFALGGPAGAGIGSALGGGIGSLASGGGFSPTSGAGAFGGLIGNAGSSLFPGFGGLLGGGGGGLAPAGGGGLSATAFNPIGQAFTMPSSSFSSPVFSPSFPFNMIGRNPSETFGGAGMYNSRAF